jgi:hypothetical protein
MTRKLEDVLRAEGVRLAWWLAGGTEQTRKDVIQCHFGHPKFCIKLLGLEPGAAR